MFREKQRHSCRRLVDARDEISMMNEKPFVVIRSRARYAILQLSHEIAYGGMPCDASLALPLIARLVRVRWKPH